MAFLIGSGKPPVPISSWSMAREEGPWREIIAIDSETSSIWAEEKGTAIPVDAANPHPGWRH